MSKGRCRYLTGPPDDERRVAGKKKSRSAGVRAARGRCPPPDFLPWATHSHVGQNAAAADRLHLGAHREREVVRERDLVRAHGISPMQPPVLEDERVMGVGVVSSIT